MPTAPNAPTAPAGSTAPTTMDYVTDILGDIGKGIADFTGATQATAAADAALAQGATAEQLALTAQQTAADAAAAQQKMLLIGGALVLGLIYVTRK